MTITLCYYFLYGAVTCMFLIHRFQHIIAINRGAAGAGATSLARFFGCLANFYAHIGFGSTGK